MHKSCKNNIKLTTVQSIDWGWLIARCGHDNKNLAPIAKRTPESERGPFSDPETTLRTIQQETFKITLSTMKIGKIRKINDPSWSIKAVLNSSEGGFWVRKGSSFRFRGPFCKWS